MTKIRAVLIAAALALVSAATFSAPASAGICDQQGHRVLIKGVWHKVVRTSTGRVIDCGLGW